MESEKVKEIKKAISCCISENDCTENCCAYYKNKKSFKCMDNLLKDILILINEFEKENERLCKVQGSINCDLQYLHEKLTNAENEINDYKVQITELESENKRLKEENHILKSNPPIIVGRSIGKSIRAKLIEYDRLKQCNISLEDQIAKLENENTYLRDMITKFRQENTTLYDDIYKKVVKDIGNENQQLKDQNAGLKLLLSKKTMEFELLKCSKEIGNGILELATKMKIIFSLRDLPKD